VTITEFLGQVLIYFFTKMPGIGDAMAAFLALGLVIVAYAIAARYRKSHHNPLVTAIDRRVAAIDRAIGGPDADIDEARHGFAAHFSAIDTQMMEADHVQSRALRRTWEEYRETIVDPGAEVLHNTARPENFFLGLADRHRGLGWFANIFIAIGLLITFLGIIAALSTLDFSGGPDAMQGRLNELMKVAGAKFWASVGGIVASIILRAYDYRFGKRIDEGLSTLCDKLEHGMVYLPPQRIASDQLEQLKEQTPALRAFSEQLAVALDGALEKQMKPMIAHLGSIQDGIAKISGGGGDAVREAIAIGAGAQMDDLAGAIGEMTLAMATMADRFEKQTGEADRQIEEAVRRFSQASEEMRSAFGELNRNFGAVAERMRADSEDASSQARQRMDELLGNLGTTLDGMKAGLARAAGDLGEASSRAATDAARVGQEALDNSFSKFVERFAEAGDPLVRSMRDASGAIKMSADGLSSSEQAIGDHARAIEGVARNSTDLATALGTAANDVNQAAAPVRQSADAMEKAALAIERSLTAEARSNEAARGATAQMAEALRETARSAEQAWSDYRARFNEVDRSLGQALTQLTDASSMLRNLLACRRPSTFWLKFGGLAKRRSSFAKTWTCRGFLQWQSRSDLLCHGFPRALTGSWPDLGDRISSIVSNPLRLVSM
jgi:methyl-accepting chemotaxis protein